MRKPERHGLTMLEVLIALVILGIIATLFGQSSWIAQKSSGKSVDWVQEGIVIEKTIENLRIGHTLIGLQTLDSTWTDRTGQYALLLTAKGSAPLAAECPGYPVANLARIAICARRTTTNDSLAVTTFLWVP